MQPSGYSVDRGKATWSGSIAEPETCTLLRKMVHGEIL